VPPGPRSPHRLRTRTLPRRILVLGLVAALVGLPARAAADPTVAAKLVSSKDYKVRLQAALLLAKLKDPRTQGALLTCLAGEPQYLVKAICATALGNLGSPIALPALRLALLDKHPFVRERVQMAIDRIGLLHPGVGANGHALATKRKARVFLQVLRLGHKGRRLAPRNEEHLTQTLRLKLNESASVEVGRSPTPVPAQWLQSRNLKAMSITVDVVLVDRRRQPDLQTVTVGVRAVLSRYPTGGMVLMTSTEAMSRQSVKGQRQSAAEREQVFLFLEREAVDGVVERLAQRLIQGSGY
jgi:hypothetical protein